MNKRIVLRVCVSPKQAERLKASAKSRGLSLSAHLRKAGLRKRKVAATPPDPFCQADHRTTAEVVKAKVRAGQAEYRHQQRVERELAEMNAMKGGPKGMTERNRQAYQLDCLLSSAQGLLGRVMQHLQAARENPMTSPTTPGPSSPTSP